jgi:hypothetical protein
MQTTLGSALGDARMPNDDASYEGEQSTSLLSLDYYRSKAREFQVLMNALDEGYRAAVATLEIGVDAETADYLRNWIADFESRRAYLRTIAEGINLASNAVNSAGGRMPVLSVPTTLGLVPIAIGAAGVAAFAAAAAAITWGAQFISGLNQRMAQAQLLDAASPEARDRIAVETSRVNAAAQAFNFSPLTALAPLLKWGAIAAAAWLAWKMLAPKD